MKNSESITAKGDVEIILEWKNGKKEILDIKNTVLKKGRQALAKAIANDIGDGYQFYVTRMIFGDGGTKSGVKKYVDASRTGLFGITQLIKPVVANVDNNIPEQAIFTSVIAFDELNGVTINEMALEMANGDLYSMTTFPDLSKTETIQITFNWRLLYV